MTAAAKRPKLPRLIWTINLDGGGIIEVKMEADPCAFSARDRALWDKVSAIMIEDMETNGKAGGE